MGGGDGNGNENGNGNGSRRSWKTERHCIAFGNNAKMIFCFLCGKFKDKNELLA